MTESHEDYIDAGHSDASRVADHWGRLAAAQDAAPEAVSETNWLESDTVISEYINPLTTGDPARNWMTWSVDTVVPDAKAACTLGCGSGRLERHARELGLGARFEAYDISESALEVATSAAEREGYEEINYICADLNEVELPANTYDVVFASMSLHHVREIDALFETVSCALVPGGKLIFNEFVGPRQFQWTDLQLAIVNRLLGGLPERLRVDRTRPGAIKREVRCPTIEEMNVIDPSEAIRSDLILPACHRFLRPVVQRDYGGTVLSILLDRIVGNFQASDPEALGFLRQFFQLETLCLRTGVLPSDYTIAVFEKV